MAEDYGIFEKECNRAINLTLRLQKILDKEKREDISIFFYINPRYQLLEITLLFDSEDGLEYTDIGIRGYGDSKNIEALRKKIDGFERKIKKREMHNEEI